MITHYWQKLAPVFVVIVLLSIAAAGFFYYKYQKSQEMLRNSVNNSGAVSEETKRLVAEVGKIIDLPAGEDPTIATVTDVEKLKGQAFFQKAKNGDKVLVYNSVQKAYLYDPKAKKIIDVSPISIGSSSAQQSATPSATKEQ